MTRILFIHHWGGYGGAGTSLANLILTLDRDKFEPVVVCPKGEVVEQLKDTGAEVRLAPRPIHAFPHHAGHAKPFFSRAFLRPALMQWRDLSFWEDYVRRSGADIVHLNSMTLAPMAVSARRAGAKSVCHVRETVVRGLLGLRMAWLRHIWSKWTDAVVHISEFDRRAAGCRAPIVEVIRNWVDLSKFDRSMSQRRAREQTGLPAEGQIVLLLGGVKRVKGMLPLARAVDRLRDMRDLLLVVAGPNEPLDSSGLSAWRRARRKVRQFVSPHYHTRVMDFITRQNLGNRIRFVGSTRDVVPLYAAADVVVFPALVPHQARPVFEAGAMAKPVIASDFECLREQVLDGVNGLTVPANDDLRLAQAIRRILDDRELAARLGEENYRMTCAKHTVESSAPKLAALYERVAALPTARDCTG